MGDFVLFQSFFTEDEAAPVIEILGTQGIEYRLDRLKQPLDATMAGDVVDNKIFLNIRSRDFAKANEALDKVILDNLNSLEQDYYLFSFTNEELNEIIHKPDEWSRQDFLIAKKILQDRGQDMPDEKIRRIRSNRITELGKQESGDSWWIIMGYALALVGGIMAVIIALPFLFAKKTLPDGNRVFIYNPKTREHGKIILLLTVIVIIVNAFFFPDNLIFAFFGFVGHQF